MNELQQVMGQLGTPTLKAFAAVFDVPQQRLYSVAKQPKAGEVYDAKVYNWDAIQRFVTRRLDAEKGLGTFEDVVNRALAKDVEFQAQDGRRCANRGSATRQTIEVGGKQVPMRKYRNFEMEEGKPVCLRHDPEVYKIVMQTLTHTVLRPINQDGEFCSETVKCVSNTMINMKGSGPMTIDEAIQKRFSGEYKDPDAKTGGDDEPTAEAEG